MSFSTLFCVLTVALLSTLLCTIVSATSRPTFSIKDGNLDLNKICATTRNPDLCLQTLNSDPRTKTATNMHALTDIALDLATKRVVESRSTVNNLRAKASDKQLIDRYSECSRLYGLALDGFGQAMADLGSGDLDDLRGQVAAAVVFEQKCKDLFDAPPVEASHVVDTITDDISVSDMVYDIATM